MSLIQFVIAGIIVILFLIGAVMLSLRLSGNGTIERRPDADAALMDEFVEQAEPDQSGELDQLPPPHRPLRGLSRIFRGESSREL